MGSASPSAPNESPGYQRIMDVLREPAGDVYAALIRFAQTECPTFSLMWRDDIRQSAAAFVVAESLAADLIEERRVWEWPGTRVYDAPKLLRSYRFTLRALTVLLAAPSLYAWRVPDRPEDLAFYGSDGTLWLGSIAHEANAFFGPAAPDEHILLAAVPGLRISPASPDA